MTTKEVIEKLKAVQAVGSFGLLVLGHLLRHVPGYRLKHVPKHVLRHTNDRHVHNHELKQMAHTLPMT